MARRAEGRRSLRPRRELPVLGADARPAIRFTETRAFRLLLLWGIVGASALLVAAVEVRPLLSARAARPEPPDPVPEERVVVPFDGVLDGERDGAPLVPAGDGYLHVVSALDREAGVLLPPPARELKAAHLVRRPDAWRGDRVRLTGLFLGSTPIRLERPVTGREWIHRTYFSDPSGDQGFVADLLERPRVRTRGPARVDAVFLRTAEYEGRAGKLIAPLLLAREAIPLVENRTSSPAFGGILMGLAAASVVGCVALSAVALGGKRAFRRPAAAGVLHAGDGRKERP
jgi:hypothetical protein